ncbi:46381_t:CDS:1, partial [Gigaspora margarita]
MVDGSDVQKQFSDSDEKIKLRAMNEVQFHPNVQYTSKFIRTDHIHTSNTAPSKHI